MKKVVTIAILTLLLSYGIVSSHFGEINQTVPISYSAAGEETEVRYFRQPRPLEGEKISLEEAESMAPFKIGILKVENLPQPEKFGKLSFVKFAKENNVLYLVYSDKEVDPTYTSEDIMNVGVIVIVEYPNPSIEEGRLRMDAIMETLKELKRDGKLIPDCPLPQKININGYSGIFGGNVGHSVTWFTETTWYEIYASKNIPYLDLIMFAGSVGEK